MKKVLSLIILATSALIAQPPEITIPNTVSFQGLLTNPDGSIYDDGEYDITFKIIVTPETGYETTIWQEVHSVDVSNGVFSTYLGSTNNFPNNLSSEAMLEIQVGNTILSPRQPFSSVPFAFKSQTSSMSMQSQHAVIADTANYITNMPTIDSVQFASTSHHAVYADTASVSTISETATHAGTADYVINAPSPISVYDEFLSINNSSTFNTNSIVEVVDTIFEQPLLNFYLQGLINFNGNQSSAKTEIFFAPISDFGENDDGDVYLLDENPQYREEPRKLRLIGQYYNASQDSDDMNNPQISFFFYIKPELQNTPHRLVIRKAYGTGSNDMVMWGKFWGQ